MWSNIYPIKHFSCYLVLHIRYVRLIPTQTNTQNIVVQKAIAMANLNICSVKRILTISIGNTESSKWDEALLKEPMCANRNALS